jgi:nitrite reductase (NO-forming)
MLNALPVIPFVLVAFWCALISSLSFAEVAAAQDENSFLNVVIQNITLIADDDTITRVAPDNQLHPGGIEYKTMTFNGTVPGPTLRFNAGELIRFTLINNGDIVHSLNLHGIAGPSQALSGPIQPGENKTWAVKVNPEAPSVFMYHCDGDNLNGIWEHVASGMYGGIIVNPSSQDQKIQATKEFDIVFSEVYNSADNGLFKGTNGVIGSFDLDKFIEGNPDLVLTNGLAYRYIPWIGTIGKYSLNNESELFQVKPNELTRWNIINAGPRKTVNFNIAAAMIDVIYPSLMNHPISKNTNLYNYTNSSYETNSVQVHDDIDSPMYLVAIPPGSGVIIEVIFPEEGFYFGNDHDLASLLYGSGFVVSAVGNRTSVIGK